MRKENKDLAKYTNFLKEENDIKDINNKIWKLKEKKELLIKEQINKLSDFYNLKSGDIVEVPYGSCKKTLVLHSFFTHNNNNIYCELNDENRKLYRGYSLHARFYHLNSNNKINKMNNPYNTAIDVEDAVKIGTYDFETDKVSIF